MKTKYGNVRCCRFASKLEASVFAILKLRERAGELNTIRMQHSVRLGDKKWKCDFSFTDCKTQKTVFCEAKGVMTREFLWIMEMWKAVNPGKLEIWGGHYTRPHKIMTLCGDCEKGVIKQWAK